MYSVKKFIGVFAIAAVLGFSISTLAQVVQPGATPIQAFQPFYVCNQTATATGAGNTAVTATLTPPSGQYVYLCSIDIVETANATVTVGAGPAPVFTTTNLPTNLVWWGDNSALAQGVMKNVITLTFGVVPVKSATAGTAFTIVTSGGQSTQSVRINVTAFFAQ